MREPLKIRVARQSDLPSLLDLYDHLGGNNFRCPSDKAITIFRQFVSYSGSEILIGTIDGEFVASCTLIIVPNLTRGGKPYALVENVVTHTDWRNQGFGQAILKDATARAWDVGCYKVMLMTGSTKPATLAFYTSAGFEQTKTGFQVRRYPERK